MKNDGGPAFPRTTETVPFLNVPGMTMRQWYKGMALAGGVAECAGSFAERAWMCGSLADVMIDEDKEANV